MKILGSDFDNTIFFLDDAETTKKNVEAIKKFMKDGNIFCLITGRTYMEIKEELLRLELPYNYMVCGDGALIFDNFDYCLKHVKLEKHLVERTVEILKENGYDPYLEDGYNITTNPDDCIKISAEYIKDKADGERVAELIREELPVYTYASRAHVNVNNPQNNKRQAVLNLSEIASLNPKEFHVIGDSINDYEMLEAFDGAVVKKHNTVLDQLHLPEYDSVADYIEELCKK